MKQRPILFSTPMVEAIIEGRKTQTRRVVKPQIDPYSLWGQGIRNSDPDFFSVHGRFNGEDKWLRCPYGAPGDVLWVRETVYEHGRYATSSFDESGEIETRFFSEGVYSYKADGVVPDSYKMRPSIHMPKDACRLFLQITDVRVERLQDISEKDARAEGVSEDGLRRCIDGEIWNGEYKNAFQTLWQKINGPESWQANPWVWVVSFKRIQKPEDAA